MLSHECIHHWTSLFIICLFRPVSRFKVSGIRSRCLSRYAEHRQLAKQQQPVGVGETFPTCTIRAHTWSLTPRPSSFASKPIPFPFLISCVCLFENINSIPTYHSSSNSLGLVLKASCNYKSPPQNTPNHSKTCCPLSHITQPPPRRFSV